MNPVSNKLVSGNDRQILLPDCCHSGSIVGDNHPVTADLRNLVVAVVDKGSQGTTGIGLGTLFQSDSGTNLHDRLHRLRLLLRCISGLPLISSDVGTRKLKRSWPT